MSSLYDDVILLLNHPIYTNLTSLLLHSLVFVLFKNYNLHQVANVLVGCVIQYLPTITKPPGSELFDDETLSNADPIPSVVTEPLEPPQLLNKIDDLNFNFMFKKYRSKGDAVITTTGTGGNHAAIFDVKYHFGLENEQIIKSCAKFMAHSSVKGCNLVTCGKSVINSNHQKNISNIVNNVKAKSSSKSSLGKLLFGFELLLFNHGYLNFESFLHFFMNCFEDQFISIFNNFPLKEVLLSRIKQTTLKEPLHQLDPYVTMYSTKSEKERPLIVRSVNAGMEVSDVSDSADDFTEFNNGVAIERINSTKSTPTLQTQENTHSKESELLQDENDETPSNEQLKRKRDELIGNQSQDNGIEDNDNDWVDVNDEEEAYDKLLEEREVEKNGERHEAGVESSSKKPRNNDFYLTKEMIKDSYAKLESKMSDVNYGSFTQISKCGTVCKSTLSKANSILNIKTIEDFDIRVSLEENMVLVNILHMVKETIRYHVRWVKLIKADKHLSDYILKEDLDLLKKKFIYLLNLDGADGLVTFALQLINSKAFGNPKSRENVFPIAGWRGGEEKLRSISDGIKFMIETMREQGVEVDGVVYQVDFWVTTDLLSLMKISRLLFKQMCPYCMTLSTICDRRHQLRLATELGCILSIPPSKVIICLLHMKERVVERLLIDSIMLLSSNRKVISILKKMEHMERFTLRELKTKKGVMYRCYLTGNMVKSVFKNLKCLRGHICGSQYTLLILFRSISNLLDISQPLNENQQERLSILLGKMEKLYCTVYTTKPKSWYLHILFHHVPDLLKFYKTIKPYETQGFESAHIDDKEFMSHTSHNGGKESYLDRMFPGFKDQMLIQFLIPRLKKLMLCNYFDMKFHFVERRTQSYINFLKQPYPPCSLVSSEELIHSNPESTSCNNNCNNHIAITVLSQYNPSENNSTGNIISHNNEAATQAFDMAINIMEDM